jgi:hypothetical protein
VDNCSGSHAPIRCRKRIGQPFGLNFFMKRKPPSTPSLPQQPPSAVNGFAVLRFAPALRVTAAALCGCLEASGRGTSLERLAARSITPPARIEQGTGFEERKEEAWRGEQRATVEINYKRHGLYRIFLCLLRLRPGDLDGMDFGPLGRKTNTGVLLNNSSTISWYYPLTT